MERVVVVVLAVTIWTSLCHCSRPLHQPLDAQAQASIENVTIEEPPVKPAYENFTPVQLVALNNYIYVLAAGATKQTFIPTLFLYVYDTGLNLVQWSNFTQAPFCYLDLSLIGIPETNMLYVIGYHVIQVNATDLSIVKMVELPANVTTAWASANYSQLFGAGWNYRQDIFFVTIDPEDLSSSLTSIPNAAGINYEQIIYCQPSYFEEQVAYCKCEQSSNTTATWLLQKYSTTDWSVLASVYNRGMLASASNSYSGKTAVWDLGSINETINPQLTAYDDSLTSLWSVEDKSFRYFDGIFSWSQSVYAAAMNDREEALMQQLNASTGALVNQWTMPAPYAPDWFFSQPLPLIQVSQANYLFSLAYPNFPHEDQPILLTRMNV